jgi:hypothetical protein
VTPATLESLTASELTSLERFIYFRRPFGEGWEQAEERALAHLEGRGVQITARKRV